MIEKRRQLGHLQNNSINVSASVSAAALLRISLTCVAVATPARRRTPPLGLCCFNERVTREFGALSSYLHHMLMAGVRSVCQEFVEAACCPFHSTTV